MHYKEIRTMDDVLEFMNLFNHFHDSCLKELKYVSGSYVNPDLSMVASDSLKTISAVFHSQNPNLSSIEIVFLDVERLCLVPRLDHYDSIILGAHFSLMDGIFYWAEYDDFDYHRSTEFNGTWVQCKGVKWKSLCDSLGSNLTYP